ncbi:MAG: hypothetical protein JWO90_425 [Solirubrobacterales bacterium]|jgi:hypothetical protein|nr:hypothetical protein [Solirubrobacterales bacterium]
MVAAMSGNWVVGWAAGAVVVIVAAALIIAITGLARRITRQADDITQALDGARSHTDALFAVRMTNLALDRITRNLRRVRTGGAG